MQQEIVAGVGNVYRAEVLFRHRLDPWMAGRELDAPAVGGALGRPRRAAARRRPARADRRRPSRRTARTGPGPVRQGEAHYVYRRTGLPCFVCGTPVVAEPMAGRTLYRCPFCQRGRGDFGAPRPTTSSELRRRPHPEQAPRRRSQYGATASRRPRTSSRGRPARSSAARARRTRGQQALTAEVGRAEVADVEREVGLVVGALAASRAPGPPRSRQRAGVRRQQRVGDLEDDVDGGEVAAGGERGGQVDEPQPEPVLEARCGGPDVDEQVQQRVVDAGRRRLDLAPEVEVEQRAPQRPGGRRVEGDELAATTIARSARCRASELRTNKA